MGRSENSFEEWLDGHIFSKQITLFFEWLEEMEEMDTGKSMNRRRRSEMEESIMYLDDLSSRMQMAGILSSSIFKANQFLNADKLMRTAKKNGLINQVLVEVLMDERPPVEENMWYVMRLYSIFLDFYKLSPQEVENFKPVLAELHLPKKLVQKQYIFWGIVGFLLGLLAIVAVVLLVVLNKILLAVSMGILMGLGIVAFMIFGVRQSLPFQFKEVIENAELYCVRGQVSDVGMGNPFTSVKYETQTLNISTLHDSLGKLFTFYAIKPLAAKADGSSYQLIYIKGMNIALEIIPIASSVMKAETKEEQAVKE